MTEPTPPGPRDADERIGAWLDGELGDAEAEAFEAELATDPELAARVEAVREVRERLAGADAAEAPDAFAERVGRAVAVEAAGRARRADAAAHAGAEATSLAEARARRERRRKRLMVLGSAAAALVVVAAAAPVVTQLLPQPEDAGELAGTDEAAEEPRPEAADDAGDEEDAGDLDGGASGLRADDAGEADEEAHRDVAASRRTSAGEVPLVVDDQEVFTSPSTLVAHFDDRPEAVELLHAPPEEADELAERTAAALERAEAFGDTTPPEACTAEVAGAVDGPAVFARVERVILDGEPLTAHLVVTGPPGRPLESVRLHVLDPEVGCASRLTERLR